MTNAERTFKIQEFFSFVTASRMTFQSFCDGFSFAKPALATAEEFTSILAVVLQTAIKVHSCEINECCHSHFTDGNTKLEELWDLLTAACKVENKPGTCLVIYLLNN